MKTVKHLFRWVWGLALGFTAAWGWGTGTGAEPEQAPAFSLPRHGGGEKVNLDDLSGSVVVLDFFAHWCVPCVRASAEMETGIRQYYASRGSNARGRPVRVLAINIEADRPEKTEAFIQRTGMKEVLDDLGGEVFKRLGGSGIPYLVIIDATGAPAGAAPARVAYRRAGFEGVARLREVIDSIGAEAPEVSARVTVPQDHTPPGKPPTQTATVPPSSTPTSKPNATETAPGAPAKKGASLETPATEMPWPQARRPATHSDLVEKATLDIAMLRASDILLTDERLEYRQTRLDSELALSLTHAHIGLHYVPESKVEHDQDVDAERGGMQASGRFRVGDRFTALAGGGGYFGYMDYRTLWLNEHFRQLYSTRPGYETADPWGGDVSGGLRWEYLLASGFLQGDLVAQHDVIAPGYDVRLAPFPPKLIRFRDTYETLSGRLSLENVITPRLRGLQELQFTDTTSRQLRCALRSSLNFAAAEHWVSRFVISGTEEPPKFLAGSASVTLERDWNETWFAGLSGRCYKDTGQIENALLQENTAGPPLEVFEAGASVRWQGARSSFKLVIGPYLTRYERPSAALSTFSHLYQDRDWVSAQFAFAHEF